MDIEINSEYVGRIVLRLYDDIAPKTSRNFRELATGQNGFGYKGSIFHRVADPTPSLSQFMVQGGDIVNGDGTGGRSIYSRPFSDESFRVQHYKPGLLASANRGPNSNSSQFYITSCPCPWLDRRYVVFGEVLEGLNIVHKIQSYASDHISRKPSAQVTIRNCGVV
ncbi:Der f Mal f 6 allergen [Ramaria rubella]|nr:Der f Mal f 6 allergen [Ramaria rubella]